MPTVVELETILTRFEADNKDLQAKLEQSEATLKRFARTAQETANQVVNSMRSFADSVVNAATSLLGLEGGLLGVSQKAVKLYADSESLAVSFRVIIGDAKLAEKTLKDLYKFAAETPFETPEVTQAAKQMLAVGTVADALIPTMRALGDVSSALEIPLGELTYLYSTLKSQGRAFTVDIRQFAQRNIPIYIELAKVLKIATKEQKQLNAVQKAQLDNLIEEGKVGFKEVEQAFKNMSGEGGIFNDLLSEMSKVLKGVYSNVKDDVNAALREFGGIIANELRLKELLEFIGKLAKDFKEMPMWVKTTTVAVIALGTATAVLVSGFLALNVALGIGKMLLITYVSWTTIATAAVIALKVALLGLAIAGGVAIAQEVTQVGALNEELKRSVDLTNKLAAAKLKGFEKDLFIASTLQDREKELFLEEKLAKAEKDRLDLFARFQKATANRDKLLKEQTVGIPGTNRLIINPAMRSEVEQAIDEYNSLGVTLTAVTKGVESFRAELGKGTLSGVSSDSALVEMTKYLKQLELERESLGLTAQQIDLLKIKKLNLAKVDEDTIRKAQTNLNIAKLNQEILDRPDKERKQTIEDVESLTRALKEEYDTLIGINNESKIRSLELKTQKSGIDISFAGDIENLRILAKSVEQRKEYNEGMKEAKKILDEMKSPMEIFIDQQRLLSNLFSQDLLSLEQYGKAIESAEIKLNEATNAANKFRDSVKGIDAVLSGSAESRARVNAFRELTSTPQGNNVSRVPIQTAPMPGMSFRNTQFKLAGDPEFKDREDNKEIIDILKMIAQNTLESINENALVIIPAGINP